MREQHDRFGQRFFDRDGSYVSTGPKSRTGTTQKNMINCGRDTGDECTNHQPQPRQHGDECTNTHTIVKPTSEKKRTQPNLAHCDRDTGDECTNHQPQPRQHGDECTNTHTLVSKL